MHTTPSVPTPTARAAGLLLLVASVAGARGALTPVPGPDLPSLAPAPHAVARTAQGAGPGASAVPADGASTSAQDSATEPDAPPPPPRRLPDIEPTPPPPGAIVLFDGTDASAWRARADADEPAAWRVADGALEVVRGAGDIISRQAFGDALIHVEWNAPAAPGGAGQLAGNSGIKVQERYELQVLSEPLLDAAPMVAGAGSIYALAAPRTNVTRGPGAWQSYDIWFTAPRWRGDAKITNARMSVRWNGVLVHQDVELPRGTGGGPKPEMPGPSGILLQDHSSSAEEPVRYRNIWVVEAPAFTLPSSELRARVGRDVEPFAATLTRGGHAAFSVAPPLPDGLQLDPATGAITGTATAPAPALDHRITARNAAGSASVRVTIEVRP